MGQKVHPIGFRLGVNVGNRHVKEWQGKWYADKDYTKFLHEDLRVRQLIMGRLAEAGVSRVDIERSANQMTVTIHAAKPGIVIGKSGVKVEELRRNLEGMTGKRVNEALAILRFLPHKATLPVEKAVRSATANAENNFNLDVDELIVAQCYADEGRTLKRYRPRARGRANQILKRSSHVTVVVSEREA
jgi:ribosomal protein L22